MLLQPTDRAHLSRLLAEANARQERLADTDLSRLNRLIEHTPEDMTATVEAGLSLHDFQQSLREYNQWLPLDPPAPETLSIGRLLSWNLSGPHRCGYGAARDYLIGIAVVLANGHIIRAGGKVVKNVAGYDLCKLFIGARDSLGLIVEATFKLRPLPEAESLLLAAFPSVDELERVLELLAQSPLTPSILDVHRLNAGEPLTLVLGFDGAREDVDYQAHEAARLGFGAATTLDYASAFVALAPGQVQTTSVAPSRLCQQLRALGPVPFIARAANGIIYHRSTSAEPPTDLPHGLMLRVKQAYDPNGVLPACPA